MNVVRHRFSSAKIDGPDPGQIQPSHWNDGHLFTGGAAGDVLARDPTDATFGATWRKSSDFVATSAANGWAYRDPASLEHVIYFNAGGTFAGVLPTAGNFTPGTRLTLVNASSGEVILQDQSPTVASHKFYNLIHQPNATRLAPYGSAEYNFDGAYWILAAHEQGGAISLGLTGANFYGFSASEIRTQTFYTHGRDLHITGYFVGSVPADTAALQIISLPWVFPATFPVLPAICSVPVLWSPALVTVEAPGKIVLYPVNAASWPVGQVYLCFDITVPAS